MKKLNFTFKKQPKETGLARIARPWQNVDIKLGGKRVGIIFAPDYTANYWSVSFAVKKEVLPEDRAPFKWIRLVCKTDSEQEMRQWLKENCEAIIKRYDLYSFED